MEEDWEYPRDWLRWKADAADENEVRELVKVLAIALLDREIAQLFSERMEKDGYSGWQPSGGDR